MGRQRKLLRRMNCRGLHLGGGCPRSCGYYSNNALRRVHCCPWPCEYLVGVLCSLPCRAGYRLLLQLSV
jgi:hypothetical protein